MASIESAVKFMEKIAADDSHGYSQNNRNGNPDYDCSSLIAHALNQAGFDINKTSNTRNLYSQLIDCGFKTIGIGETRHRGDIFLTPGKHVVMCTDANNVVHASINELGKATGGKSGDQTKQEICTRKFYTPSYGWTYHLRYKKTFITSPTILKGIDVSAYNPISNYQAVKNIGVQFAILKIIRKDLQLDKLFETHLNGFKQVGINIHGVYNYSYSTTVAKAKTDARIVVQYLKQYNMPKSTVVYMDVEDNCQKNLGKLLIDIINAYQQVIEKSGYKFGLYTGLSFWQNYIHPYKSFLKCDREWIARYKKAYTIMDFKEEPDKNSKPNIGTPIEGYQYTSSGRVSGINGKVDLNLLYTDVNNVVCVDTLLNVRNKPNGDIIGKLKNGNVVNINDYKDGFFEIDKNQWVSADYISNVCGKVNVSNILNVREGAGTNFKDIGDLMSGDTVRILNKSNDWYLILCDEQFGWVSAKYIDLI